MKVTKREFEVHGVVVEVRIAAPPERVWRAIVDEIGSWWHRDFRVGPEPRRFRVEARIGGVMGETWGEGEGLVWATVIGVRRGVELQMAGVLAPAFGGPANLHATWTLAADGGGTLLRFEETTWGAASAQTSAHLDVGWKFLLGRCLKQWVETGRPVTEPFSG